MLGNALVFALRAIRRNVLRSFLTILGVVIGVAAVIVMATLGNGATRAVESQIASMGSDMQEIATLLTGTTQVLTVLLGTVAAVSLLVGGIGIMNIMRVAVAERTREIGIRLAIGALEREVLMQFLIEAILLSGLGGVLGILLALGVSLALADLLRVPFTFDGGIVLTAFLFSAAVGGLFGYFPARRAARIDPIEALRHE
jgi:putative ABC transport system permease protein